MLRGLALQTDASQEVQLMARTLLTRPNLEKIALATDLDLKAKNPQELQQIIDMLKSNIKFNSSGRENIYTVSFSHQDAGKAQQVVQETVNLFVESTLGSSRTDSDTATQFLDEQIAEYEKRLTAAESRLADFKRENGQYVANSGNKYYGQLAQLKDQLEAVDLQIKETESKLKQSQATLNKAKENIQSNQGDNSQLLSTQYDERIDALKSSLDELLIRFTENHPDVKETMGIVAHLEGLRKEEIKKYEDAIMADPNAAGAGNIGESLVITIQGLNNELASLNVRRESNVNKLEELEANIDFYPQVEAQLTALNRDYGITKRKYEELLSRRESANLSQQADKQRDDVQFRIIEPALKPLRPSGPNRVLLYTAVLVLGFGSGIGIAFLLSQLNPIVLRPAQLFGMTEIPVFGVVSHIDKEVLSKGNRSRLKVFWVSNSFILIGYAGFMTIEFAGYRLNSAFINKLYDFVISNVGGLI